MADTAYERLVESAQRAMDQGERMRMYAQADRIMKPHSTACLRPFPHAGDGLGEELHLFTVGLVILEGHHPGKQLVTQYS